MVAIPIIQTIEEIFVGGNEVIACLGESGPHVAAREGKDEFVELPQDGQGIFAAVHAILAEFEHHRLGMVVEDEDVIDGLLHDTTELGFLRFLGLKVGLGVGEFRAESLLLGIDVGQVLVLFLELLLASRS